MSDEKGASQNVLDEMTRGVMGMKANKAAQLTPVGLERRLPTTSAPFPNDQPQQVVEQAIYEIRRQAEFLTQAADALETHVLGKPAPITIGTEVTRQQEVERAADTAHAARQAEIAREERDDDFPARFIRLQREAQEATFCADTLSANDAPSTRADWTCPTHGDASITQLTSRRGRKYRACNVADCGEFEK